MAQNSNYKWSQIFVETNSKFEKLSQNDSSVTYSEMHDAKNCKMINRNVNRILIPNLV